MNQSLVNAQWLHDHIDDAQLVILDASPKSNVSGLESEFKEVRIKGARPIDLKADFSDTEADMPNTLLSPSAFQKAAKKLGINKADTIVVYDNLGIYTSPRVWWMFKAMGHENVAVLDGGLPEWINEGFPTEPNSTFTFPIGDFQSVPKSDWVKSMNDVLDNISDEAAIVLDARSQGRYCGTDPEPRAGLSSGHIPKSRSLPFKQVLNGNKMKTKEELIDVFRSKGINNDQLIFSCGSGLTACITFLAADIALANRKAVYDGSWTEWAQKQENLIVKDNSNP